MSRRKRPDKRSRQNKPVLARSIDRQGDVGKPIQRQPVSAQNSDKLVFITAGIAGDTIEENKVS